MADVTEVHVPDIGDFDAVDVIEVLVGAGDSVETEDSLITLETDKATMEVPAPFAGTVKEVKVSVGDKVSEGDLILVAEPAEGGDGGAPKADEPAKEAPAQGSGEKQSAAASDAGPAPSDTDCDVVVIGAGPGGYTAAFRAADLGLKVALIERFPVLGGVCLNVGCIPSKALLHAGEVMEEAKHFQEKGITFGEPSIDLTKLGNWKNSVVEKLTGGLKGMAKQRQVEVIHGNATFKSAHELSIAQDDGERTLTFKNCIIAAGSRPNAPPNMDLSHPRIMDSTDALKLEEVPERLLVVGGGIIGCEMASVYSALGSNITIVEMLDRIMAGGDPDIVKIYKKRIDNAYENIFLNSKVTEVHPDDSGVSVKFEGDKTPESDRFDRVLVSVGRRPNTDLINIEAAGVELDEQRCIPVNEHQQTNLSHIYAIGDIAGQPMLAHKGTHEGKVAAECCAGEKAAFEARTIPNVAYTNPEVAWAGYTEDELKAKGWDYEKAQFPWAANGRALSLDADDGVTKLLFDTQTERILGGAIVGPNAGDLISEVCLAIEMDADMHDISLTVHPHPTISETVAMASEAAAGTLTDLYIPKKKK